MTTLIEQTKPAPLLNGYHANGAQEPYVDRFPYGYRLVAEVQPDGSTNYSYIPLTQADFLDPQVGDHLVQSDQHFQFVVSLFNRFSAHYRHDPTVGVFSDLKMLWGISKEKEPAPDLAVVPNITDKKKHRPSFDVQEEGTRPCLVVEVVSPHYPGDDTTKVDIYERVGIEEYIIIDANFAEDESEIELTGYRLVNGRYRLIRPDPQGRLLSQTTNVWFELDQKKRNLFLVDATTGKRLLDYEDVSDALQETTEALAATNRVLMAERQRADAAEAEIARLRSLYASQG
jgi:Uma2 family endonuclease